MGGSREASGRHLPCSSGPRPHPHPSRAPLLLPPPLLAPPPSQPPRCASSAARCRRCSSSCRSRRRAGARPRRSWRSCARRWPARSTASCRWVGAVALWGAWCMGHGAATVGMRWCHAQRRAWQSACPRPSRVCLPTFPGCLPACSPRWCSRGGRRTPKRGAPRLSRSSGSVGQPACLCSSSRPHAAAAPALAGRPTRPLLLTCACLFLPPACLPPHHR